MFAPIPKPVYSGEPAPAMLGDTTSNTQKVAAAVRAMVTISSQSKDLFWDINTAAATAAPSIKYFANLLAISLRQRFY